MSKSEEDPLTFNDYQKRARETAIYPNLGNNIVYPTLGISGEAGEIAEKVKKIHRDKAGIAGEEEIAEIIKEIGDELWYLANLASELDVSLGEVARRNLEKLKSRKERGVLRGSGDNR